MNKLEKGNIRRTIFIAGILVLTHNLNAQIITAIWADAGKTNVSDGMFVKGAVAGTCKLTKNSFSIGCQSDILSHNKKLNPALTINYSREFMVDSMMLEAQPFFRYHHFSEFLYEMNYGLIMKSGYKKFIFSLGTNFRTYRLTSEAKGKYDIDESEKIHENFNLMYSLSWHLMPLSHNWNIRFTGCNHDHFIINQETNPLFNVQYSHRFRQPGSFYFELWYQSAGALNLSVNTFGYFFRTGIKWQIER